MISFNQSFASASQYFGSFLLSFSLFLSLSVKPTVAWNIIQIQIPSQQQPIGHATIVHSSIEASSAAAKFVICPGKSKKYTIWLYDYIHFDSIKLIVFMTNLMKLSWFSCHLQKLMPLCMDCEYGFSATKVDWFLNRKLCSVGYTHTLSLSSFFFFLYFLFCKSMDE